MTKFVPRGLCVYCGEVRSPDAPAVRCAACGRDAREASWWQESPGQRDAVTVALWTVAAIAPFGYVVHVATRVVDGDPVGVVRGAVAAAALVVLVVSVMRVAARPYGSWSFAGGGVMIGGADWHERTLGWAHGHEALGAQVRLPAACAAVTADAVRALGDEAVLAMAREGLGVAVEDIPVNEIGWETPLAVLGVVGMIARDEAHAYWQRGWRQSTLTSPRRAATRQLALARGAVRAERSEVEARVLDTLDALAVRVPPSRDADTHYRAQGDAGRTVHTAWESLLDHWEKHGAWREPETVMPEDAARDAATRAGLVAAMKAEPDLVRALLGVEPAAMGETSRPAEGHS